MPFTPSNCNSNILGRPAAHGIKFQSRNPPSNSDTTNTARDTETVRHWAKFKSSHVSRPYSLGPRYSTNGNNSRPADKPFRPYSAGSARQTTPVPCNMNARPLSPTSGPAGVTASHFPISTAARTPHISGTRVCFADVEDPADVNFDGSLPAARCAGWGGGGARPMCSCWVLAGVLAQCWPQCVVFLAAQWQCAMFIAVLPAVCNV